MKLDTVIDDIVESYQKHNDISKRVFDSYVTSIRI